MAERRMFNKALMFSDLFTRLHHKATLLYIYICLHADDDGICGNSQALARLYGCSKSHIQTLIDGGWLLPFDTGEVAVAHWHLHNQIRKDRYRPSIYTHVTNRLKKGADGVYVITQPGCQEDNQPVANLSTAVATQERIDQLSPVKDSIAQYSPDQDRPGKAIQAEPGCPSSGPLDAACDDIDYDNVLYHYQALCRDLTPCHQLTPRIREKIQACYRLGYNQYRFVPIFAKAGASAFLQGDNKRGWKASLDWLLEPAHLQEVVDGKYDTW